MTRRYRTRGAYLAAEFRELLSVIMGLCAIAGGVLLGLGVLNALGLIR